jgi:hypothetical protein
MLCEIKASMAKAVAPILASSIRSNGSWMRSTAIISSGTSANLNVQLGVVTEDLNRAWYERITAKCAFRFDINDMRCTGKHEKTRNHPKGRGAIVHRVGSAVRR